MEKLLKEILKTLKSIDDRLKKGERQFRKTSVSTENNDNQE